MSLQNLKLAMALKTVHMIPVFKALSIVLYIFQVLHVISIPWDNLHGHPEVVHEEVGMDSTQ